jgi:hypothetical protein
MTLGGNQSETMPKPNRRPCSTLSALAGNKYFNFREHGGCGTFRTRRRGDATAGCRHSSGDMTAERIPHVAAEARRTRMLSSSFAINV